MEAETVAQAMTRYLSQELPGTSHISQGCSLERLYSMSST